MKFNPFSEPKGASEEESELSPEEKLQRIAYSMEDLGVQGEQIIDISPEIREQLEEVHEFLDPETKLKIEYLLANPKAEKGIVLVNGDFTADCYNVPLKEFLAYMAELYPDYKVMFQAPPGYGTDDLKKFKKTQKRKERRTIFSPFAEPSLRALESISVGEDGIEDVIIVGQSMGAHIAVEQALAAQGEAFDLSINQVVLMAPPSKKNSLLGLKKDFDKDEERSLELQKQYEYINSIIPDQDVKDKEFLEKYGAKGVLEHLLKYSWQMAKSQFNKGLVELVLDTDIDVRLSAGSEDSVANSKDIAPAQEKIKAGGKTLHRRIMIGWRHGTTADIPRRVVNIVREMGRGGQELLDAKMIAKKMQSSPEEETA